MKQSFTWKEITAHERGLTFDDVLLIPNKSASSRREPDMTSLLTKSTSITIPIISANMDTVTESDMAIAMQKIGAFGIVHRFMSDEKQTKQVQKIKKNGVKLIGVSIGVRKEEKIRAKKLINAGANIITIDIAHGHADSMLSMIKWLKDSFPQIQIIAGNVATAEGARDLICAGADAIKVGIGPGSMCTTRIITGCGVPQLTAIANCAQVGFEYEIPIIADGGLRASGDIMKAFAAGASSVMLGAMLAGTLETPMEVKNGMKAYRGMASKSAQISWRGGVPKGMAAEGEDTRVPVKGHVEDIIWEITGGIRSGMSYLGATKFKDIINKAKFIEITNAGAHESHAHGLHT